MPLRLQGTLERLLADDAPLHSRCGAARAATLADQLPWAEILNMPLRLQGTLERLLADDALLHSRAAPALPPWADQLP